MAPAGCPVNRESRPLGSTGGHAKDVHGRRASPPAMHPPAIRSHADLCWPGVAGRSRSIPRRPALPPRAPPPAAATYRRFDPLSPGGRLNVSGSLPATFCGKATGT